MVHEQKFKDLLSSKCQVSPERIVLDMESEFMIGPGSIPTGDNFFTGFLFSHSKASDANIGIINKNLEWASIFLEICSNTLLSSRKPRHDIPPN